VPEWEPIFTPVLNEFLNEYEDKDTGKKYTSGSFTLIEFPEFSLGSRQQIAERLTRAGYRLTKKTDKGNPIIDDTVLQEAADAGIPEAKPLAEYFLIQKREAMVRDWLAKAVWHEDQGVYRIHGYVNSLGANSSRMTHSSPNVAQVPASHNPYGDRCRSLFTVRKGFRLVGCDASGLELRMLAHYMNDDQYTDTILNGDIHTANQIAAGLPERSMAKTMIYGFLYGAGDFKLGQIVGGGAKEGKALKDKFLANTPALKRLREKVLDICSRRKYLKGLDGRFLRIRSSHSALNTLLQGAGAIVMKYWLVEVASKADEENLVWGPSANVHDEGQFEVLEKDVPRFKQICEEAFETTTEILKLRCPVAGESQDGVTWNETH
jgi:DNA polymerase I-like protein with 3'-5' exonuclease and polymerase domains